MSSDYHYVYVGDASTNNVGETGPPSRESYTWTDDMALRLIRFRIEFRELFTRKKGSATIGYRKIAAILGIGAENFHCVKKKWENMVDKYRQEIKKIVGTECEEFPVLRSTWKFYDAMSEALGLEREISRVKLSMMVTNTAGCSSLQLPLVAHALESNNESSISNTEQTTTSNLLQSEPQMYTAEPTQIKVEASEFEFDKIFVPEEQEDESMLQCTPIDSLLQKTEFNNADDNNVMPNLNIEPNIMSRDVNDPPAANNSRVLLPAHLQSLLVKPSASASASQAAPRTPGLTVGIVQSRPRTTAPALSDAASSCSSDDVAYTPYSKKSNTRRGKKRKAPDNDELLELIKKGDEELRSDFKQLIEIQRKTSEHIGALVNYLINKDKK